MAALTCSTTTQTFPLKYAFKYFQVDSSSLPATYDGKEKVR
jgi:hypothetical protein